MYRKATFIVFGLILQILIVICVEEYDICKEKCDALSDDSSKVLFYGTDDQDHLITYSKKSGTSVMKCYRKCGVTAVYPGTEGCPNYCSSFFGQGNCWNGTCHCNDGWTGEDCSVVVCPNSCSGHGICSEETNTCICEEGYWANDCSAPIVQMGPYPFGQWVNDRPYYSPSDKYGDSHPIFNTSVISQFRLFMNNSDLDYLLQPENQADQKYIECTMHFDNQIVYESRTVGVRLKGQSTPEYLKKGWKISFSKFEGKKFYGLDALGLKYPYPDDSMMRNQLYMDMLRAFNVPVFRGSYATLWINDIYIGVYWLQEELDENFIESRYSQSEGNFYRNGAQNAFFGYLGEDPKLYEDLQVEHRGAIVNVYKQESGDDSFSDFATFVAILNLTPNDTFAEEIVKIFNVDLYLRALAVEVYTLNTDCYHRNGNNWALYHNPATGLFEFFSHDFDFSMRTVSNINSPIYNDSSVNAVLTNRILNVPEFRKTYTYYMKMLTSSMKMEAIANRMNTVESLILPQLSEDLFYRLDWGRTAQSFFNDKAWLTDLFPQRTASVQSQLDKLYDTESKGAQDNQINIRAVIIGSTLSGLVVVGAAVIAWKLKRKPNNYVSIK